MNKLFTQIKQFDAEENYESCGIKNSNSTKSRLTIVVEQAIDMMISLVKFEK